MAGPDESRDAPKRAPLGFAMPDGLHAADLVYRMPAIAPAAREPVPAGFAAPGQPVPDLAALSPTPPDDRNPSQPFSVGSFDDAVAAPWDPTRPLLVTSDHLHPDDVPTTGADARPDYAPPTGRPVLPAPPPPAWHAGGYPQAVAARPAATPGPTQPASARPDPRMGQFVRPAGPGVPQADPYQAMHQPYPQARPSPAPWQTGPYPAPPGGTTGRPAATVNFWMVAALVCGALFVHWAFLLLCAAWFIALAARGLRHAVTVAFGICTPIVLGLWGLLYLFHYDPFVSASDPTYQIAARVGCGVILVVTFADHLLDKYARHRR